MKYNLLAVCFAIFFSNVLIAQDLTKDEKKALKKELRNYLKEPIKFKYIKENLEVKDVIIKEQLDELTTATNERNEAKASLNAARDSIGFYQSRIQEYTASKNDVNCLEDDGMKYRVQIGLYKNFDIRSFINEIKVLSFEQIDGMYRYTLGNFTTEDEAELFKEAIRKMGIRGAFVSYYLDGQRIPK